MAHIPLVSRDTPFTDAEKPYAESFLGTRGVFPDVGPYSTMLHMPVVAEKVDSLRRYLRDEASLPQNVQELVMISVAREMDCVYIWHAHAAAARKNGVRGDIIDNIRDKKPLSGLTAAEQAAVDFTRELLRSRKVSKATFDKASANFGQRGTLTLTNLVACYAVLAYNMNTYEVGAPAGGTELPLPV